MSDSRVLSSETSNRIEFLDILRGVAILFIFLVNIQHLSGVHYYSEEFESQFLFPDFQHFLEMLFFVLFTGKFYFIFSLLFGIGFVVQYQNIVKRNLPYKQFFIRRMLALLVIGLIHLFFIWSGDILTLYAVLGLTLIFFVDFDDRRLLKWAFVLLLLPIVHWLFMYATRTYYYYPLFDFVHEQAAELDLVTPDSKATDRPRFDASQRIAADDFSTWFQMQVVLPVMRLGLIIMEGRLFKVLALFLLGMWAGRKILREHLLDDQEFLKKLVFWGFIIGVPFNILFGILKFSDLITGNFRNFLNHLSFAIGVTSMAFAYAASIALLVRSRPNLLRWFAPVGRMALTNYLSQSILGILIFHGIGFGYFGVFSFSEIIAIAMLLFVLQVVFSVLWLKRFRYGPVEWVWRQATYGKRLPIWRDKAI